MLRLYDTALRRLVEVVPREEGRISMYVCGPTVSGEPHIGHGRFALTYDVMRRYLEWRGYAVRYVSNITDIEDKIINRAAEEGRSTEEVVATYEASWYRAMDGLGIRRPDADPHATAYVAQMTGYIAELVDRGRAYETGDGVYFSVATVEDYGLLAGQPLDSLRAGAGGRQTYDDEKRSPFDFVLWKKAKPGEPSWPSPWGHGRPGWHIECTVMALDLLGEGFDIHGGGLDLTFPHHENERAQAVGNAKRFATTWVHNGLVTAGGQKMGKSEGNAVSLPELLEAHDARAYRLLVLRAHYRSPLEVTPATLADAEAALDRLDAFARRFPPGGAAPLDDAAVSAFRDAMDDDLDTPRATAQLFDLVREANATADAGDGERAATAGATAHHIAAALGLSLDAVVEAIDAKASAMAAERDAARAARDFATADRLRAELEALGWVVEDSAGGTTLRRS